MSPVVVNVPETEHGVPVTESEGVPKTENDDVRYPEFLYVSGMPFWLMGWNGKYRRIFRDSDRIPYYIMAGRIRHFGIINGTQIRYHDSRWTFQETTNLGWRNHFCGSQDIADPESGWEKFKVSEKHEPIREIFRNYFF
jgi:hypothetical protein